MKINIEKRHLYILVGLIILASVGYVIAQTPGVSHHPAEISPQGSGSGLDADKVDGLHVSSLCRGDMNGCPSGFALGGGATYVDEGDYCSAGTVWGEARCTNGVFSCNRGTKRQVAGRAPGISDSSQWYLCIS